jgi:hypothetical protein
MFGIVLRQNNGSDKYISTTQCSQKLGCAGVVLTQDIKTQMKNINVNRMTLLTFNERVHNFIYFRR